MVRRERGGFYHPSLIPETTRTTFFMLVCGIVRRRGATYDCGNNQKSHDGHPAVEIPPPPCTLISGFVHGTKLTCVIICTFVRFVKIAGTVIPFTHLSHGIAREG